METQNNKRAISRSLDLSSSERRKNKTRRINKSNNEISYYDEKWPSKLVILITSHGYFKKDKTKEYENGEDTLQKYKIPEGIKVNYFYASAHGSSTVYVENDAEQMFNFIKTHMSDLISNNNQDISSVLSEYSNLMMNLKDKLLNNFSNQFSNEKQLLQNSIKMYKKQQSNKNIKFVKRLSEHARQQLSDIQVTKKEFNSINNSYLKGFTYKTYNENEFIPNKDFNRHTYDIIQNKNVSLNKYNFAIRIMNLKNQPDILDLLQSKRYKKGNYFTGINEIIINTQTIIDLCKEHGVKEIIFIDSSCGGVDGNYREKRNISRSINREPNVKFLLNKTKAVSKKSIRSSQK